MFKYKIIGLALALVLIAGLVAVASGATGAYFGDTKSGEIAGTIGTVKVSAGANADTGGGLNFFWTTCCLACSTPRPSTTRTRATSAGHVAGIQQQDALSRFNSIGRYGAVRITDSNTGTRFESNNLNDHPVEQGTVTPDGREVRKLPEQSGSRRTLDPLPVGR